MTAILAGLERRRRPTAGQAKDFAKPAPAAEGARASGDARASSLALFSHGGG